MPQQGSLIVRPFEWHDLLMVYRYRHQVLCLDQTGQLINGSPIGLGALLRQLKLTDYGDYTGVVVPENSKPLMGQMNYSLGRRAARLSFLLPDSALDAHELPLLLENLAIQAGERGATRLLADVADRSPAFEALRHAGFVVYGWQNIWQAPSRSPAASAEAFPWQPYTPADEIAVSNLYHVLVPPLVQSAEAFDPHTSQGWVYRQNGDITAWVEAVTGPQGVCLQPLIHPATENVGQLLRGLALNPSRWFGRPVHLVVRSYQEWLTPTMEEMGALVSPRQALLVKHLSVASKVAEVQELYAHQNILDKGWVGPTTSVRSATLHPVERVASHETDRLV